MVGSRALTLALLAGLAAAGCTTQSNVAEPTSSSAPRHAAAPIPDASPPKAATRPLPQAQDANFTPDLHWDAGEPLWIAGNWEYEALGGDYPQKIVTIYIDANVSMAFGPEDFVLEWVNDTQRASSGIIYERAFETDWHGNRVADGPTGESATIPATVPPGTYQLDVYFQWPDKVSAVPEPRVMVWLNPDEPVRFYLPDPCPWCR